MREVFRQLVRAVGLSLALAAQPLMATESFDGMGLGQPLRPLQLQSLPATVFPHGRGLPAGQGSVTQGTRLYAQHCAACHGTRGREGPMARLAGSDGFFEWTDPLRPLRILRHPVLVLSVGAQWPHAPALFDYIWRAMPYQAPKTLNADEVYAITAYLLHLNRLLPADAALDRESLPQVQMPGLPRSVSAWPGAMP